MSRRKPRERYHSRSQDSSLISKLPLPAVTSPGNKDFRDSKFKVFLSPKVIRHTMEMFNKPAELGSQINFNGSIPTLGTLSKLEPTGSMMNIIFNSNTPTPTPSSPRLIQLKKPASKTPVRIKVKKPENLNSTVVMKKVLENPFQIQKVNCSDERETPTRGELGLTKFYRKFKIIDKVTDVNNLYGVKNDATTNILVKSQSLKLLPSKIGFVNNQKSDPETFHASHFRIGDSYAEVMAEGLKVKNDYIRYELNHNRLSAKGAEIIIPKINPQNVKYLNLSGNHIGKNGIDSLAELIQRYDCKIIDLNLGGNKLGDGALENLYEALEFNRTLRRINLSNNDLTDTAAIKIAASLETNISITEVYCQWNQFKTKGGLAILKALSINKNIRVLDLSWNSLGLLQSTFAETFCEFISLNTSLIHLDLSNNYFCKEDCAIIAEGLKENHTLYGFHFHGNIGYVDSKGFLIIPEDHYQSVSSLHTIHNIDGVKMQPESIKRHNGNAWELKDICWICEGWNEVTLSWNPGSSGDFNQDPIFIHLSYENSCGRYISKLNEFKMKRMVPPLKFSYFFTVQGNQMAAEDQPREEPRIPEIKVNIQGKIDTVHVPLVNYMIPKKMIPIMDSDYNPRIEIQPRTPDEWYTPPEDVRIRPHWSNQFGIYRDYKFDTKELLDKAFEFDIRNSKMARVVRNPEEYFEIKNMFKENYKNLKDCYRFFSAIGTISDVWSIPMNALTDFCKNSGILDYKLLKMADLDRLFITTYTKAEKKKNHRSPDHALVRHQFPEILMRIAQQKYQPDKKIPNTVALQKLLDELLPYIKDFDTDKWRHERYFTEEVDTVMKSYAPIIKGVYRKYSSAKIPGQRPYMSLNEFKMLIGDAQMFNDVCGERDAVVSLVNSLMTQVDELFSDRVFQIQYLEFLEAFARMADIYSAAPYGENESMIPYTRRKEQNLGYKIEGLIPILMRNCVENIVRETWILPTTSIFEMEEVYGKQKVISKKRQIVRLDPTHPTSHTYYDR